MLLLPTLDSKSLACLAVFFFCQVFFFAANFRLQSCENTCKEFSYFPNLWRETCQPEVPSLLNPWMYLSCKQGWPLHVTIRFRKWTRELSNPQTLFRFASCFNNVPRSKKRKIPSRFRCWAFVIFPKHPWTWDFWWLQASYLTQHLSVWVCWWFPHD